MAVYDKPVTTDSEPMAELRRGIVIKEGTLEGSLGWQGGHDAAVF